jgi:hypothetical protein
MARAMFAILEESKAVLDAGGGGPQEVELCGSP